MHRHRQPTHARPARARRGFTLIELMLVMVILAVLAAIVLPSFTGRSQEARLTAAKADIANIETALEAFEIDNGRYPEAGEGLAALIENPASLETWKGPYLKRGVPKDPWGNAYTYEQPGAHNINGFDLYSAGPDGQAGSDDDVTNWDKDDSTR
ncbi:MAG: type II secretion system protein GspG [Phycisphaera sp.]|nr:type II secretion system protein GspG [Phycisphaera sp.]